MEEEKQTKPNQTNNFIANLRDLLDKYYRDTGGMAISRIDIEWARGFGSHEIISVKIDGSAKG
jgi:hypothetical protein